MVEALDLKEGDEINISVTGKRNFKAPSTKAGQKHWLRCAALRNLSFLASDSTVKKQTNDSSFLRYGSPTRKTGTGTYTTKKSKGVRIVDPKFSKVVAWETSNAEQIPAQTLRVEFPGGQSVNGDMKMQENKPSLSEALFSS